MSSHLYIAGVDRWKDYRENTLNIEQVLTYQVDTCSLEVSGTQPLQGSELIIEDDILGRLFAGIIDRVELVHNKAPLTWRIEAQDYTLQMDRKLVVETYEGYPANWIARDIITKYCPGFSIDGIRNNAPVIESTGGDFNYKTPSECMKWLCDYVGWHWYVDYFKVVHFFDPAELCSPAPMVLQPGGRFHNFSVTIDHQGLRNRVYILGGTMLSNPQTIEWKADGAARQWVLPWLPHECSLQVGGVSKTLGIENVDEEPSYDYLLNCQDKYIRCSEQTATTASGVTFSLTARQDVDVISISEDLGSQLAVAAIEGGDGVYEHSITDTSLETIEAAEAAGQADLRQWANPKTSGSFETRVPGWSPGQLVQIHLPDRGVNSVFLVQKVGITKKAGQTGFGENGWVFTIEYGGRLLGIADFLKALVSAQQKKKLNDTNILHKFTYKQDDIQVTDELVITSRELPYHYDDSDTFFDLAVYG